MPDSLRLQDFDYDLPETLIAQHPTPQRSGSRLLHVQTQAQGDAALHDRSFQDLCQLLQPTDLLILNDTKVVQARIFGQRATGGKVEILLERVLQEDSKLALVHLKASKKPKPGEVLQIMRRSASAFDADSAPIEGGAPYFQAQFIKRWPDEEGSLFLLSFDSDAFTVMDCCGYLPLPPYITHSPDPLDAQRYQTIFADKPGAVAAPTAALHFDEALFARLDERGVQRAYVTLHVGAGTFSPVKTDEIAAHKMHSERYHIPPATLAAIARTRSQGGRIVAVGTTTVRTLESWAATGSTQGETDIFITPGFRFQVVDALLTNFHLPKSTLMMLVSAFAGFDTIRLAYQHAIQERYRFFSYGDAMLLECESKSRGDA